VSKQLKAKLNKATGGREKSVGNKSNPKPNKPQKKNQKTSKPKPKSKASVSPKVEKKKKSVNAKVKNLLIGTAK
jgi:hypothetical protein